MPEITCGGVLIIRAPNRPRPSDADATARHSGWLGRLYVDPDAHPHPTHTITVFGVRHPPGTGPQVQSPGIAASLDPIREPADALASM